MMAPTPAPQTCKSMILAMMLVGPSRWCLIVLVGFCREAEKLTLRSKGGRQ
jgi:hypothetical protein